MFEKKKTIWSSDLDIFADEDHRRWSFKGGGKAPKPPPPPPPPEETEVTDGRPDDSASKGIEEASRARSNQRKRGSRGGLKIGLNNEKKGVGISTTQSVVYACVAIFITDYIMAALGY